MIEEITVLLIAQSTFPMQEICSECDININTYIIFYTNIFTYLISKKIQKETILTPPYVCILTAYIYYIHIL